MVIGVLGVLTPTLVPPGLCNLDLDLVELLVVGVLARTVTLGDMRELELPIVPFLLVEDGVRVVTLLLLGDDLEDGVGVVLPLPLLLLFEFPFPVRRFFSTVRSNCNDRGT